MVENFSEWFHNILEEANITDSRYPIKGMAIGAGTSDCTSPFCFGPRA